MEVVSLGEQLHRVSTGPRRHGRVCAGTARGELGRALRSIRANSARKIGHHKAGGQTVALIERKGDLNPSAPTRYRLRRHDSRRTGAATAARRRYLRMSTFGSGRRARHAAPLPTREQAHVPRTPDTEAAHAASWPPWLWRECCGRAQDSSIDRIAASSRSRRSATRGFPWRRRGLP